MIITDIYFNNVEPKESGICAECTVIFDDMLCVHRISVINGNDGLFVAFPNTGAMKRYKNCKRYVDIVHPVNNSARQMIQSEVLKRYNECVSELSSKSEG